MMGSIKGNDARKKTYSYIKAEEERENFTVYKFFEYGALDVDGSSRYTDLIAPTRDAVPFKGSKSAFLDALIPYPLDERLLAQQELELQASTSISATGGPSSTQREDPTCSIVELKKLPLESQIYRILQAGSLGILP